MNEKNSFCVHGGEKFHRPIAEKLFMGEGSREKGREQARPIN